MEFGFRDGGSAQQAFREGFDLVDAAEAWGLDSTWLSEFHFTPDRSVLYLNVFMDGVFLFYSLKIVFYGFANFIKC